jgi:single-strand DNA-binding protein
VIGLPMVTVVGTMTDDASLRFTASGVAVLNVTLACNERRYNKATQQFEDGQATFLDVSLWRQPGENAAELRRGTRVIAVGVLKQRSFEDRDGNKRTVMEMEAEELGPSSKFAVVTSTKSSGGSETGGNRQPAYSGGGAEDPWGAGPDTPSQSSIDAPF